MTYRQFISDLIFQASVLEHFVKDSQVINLNDEIGEDDTFLDVYRDGVEELMDNVISVHGHVVTTAKTIRGRMA